MVKIRLLRVGTKKQAKYRVVVTDKDRKRDGGFIEIIGNYNPSIEPSVLELDKSRYDYWLSKGAQPTKTTQDLYKRHGRSS